MLMFSRAARLVLFAAFVIAFAAAGSAATQGTRSANFEYDVIIRGGRIVDGAGNPWFYADVGIRGERIVKISRKLEGSARRVIDARGLVVAPGFIDTHSHSDFTLLVDGNAESKIRQGVTTEVLGEANSVAPVCPGRESSGQLENRYNIRRDWKDLEGYFRRLLRQGTSVNVATYVAGGQIRMCGMGLEMRAPTAEELKRMESLADEAMRQGALGFSTGLIYPPNSYAKTDELVALARVAARYGGIYTTHMRGEGAQLLDAVKETISISEQAGLPAHILHLKSSGEKNWGKIRDAVALIEQARARGVEISADQYPYVASSTGLTTQVPQWAQDGGREKMLARFRDAGERNRIREQMLRANSDPSRMMVAMVRTEANKAYEGKTIAEVAAMRNQDPQDTILDLLLEEHGDVRMVYFTMNEDDVRYALKQPWVSIGSDGTAVKPEGVLGEGKPHPRWYGTFPRVLGKYVREEHVLPLEEAVRKMTSLPAAQLGIHQRGLLAEGYYADVVLFDPDRISDKATFTEPHQYAEGIDYVLVNGRVVLDHGRHTGAHPGRAIYGPGYSGPNSRQRAQR